MPISSLMAVAPAMLSFLGGQMTNSANASNASNQMQFQQNMSNTAYQRATADMEKAGLNPMLAYSQGGATTPGGAMSTSINPVPAAVNSYFSAQQTRADLQNKSAQTDLINAQAAQTAQQARSAKLDADLKQSNWDSGSASVAKSGLDAEQAKNALSILQSSSDWNSLTQLNDYAYKLGYGNSFDAAAKSVEFRSALSDSVLRSNLIPQSQKDASFASGVGGTVTPWAKLLPFVNSAGSTYKLTK